MKAVVVIRLSFPSKRHLKTALQALEPESGTQITPRSRVRIEKESDRNVIKIRVEAKDIAALRAAVNSYLSLIYITNTILDVIKKHLYLNGCKFKRMH